MPIPTTFQTSCYFMKVSPTPWFLSFYFSFFLTPIDSILFWLRLAESHRVIWKFTELSQHSENHGVGSLRARLEVSNGPSQQGTIATQFNCEGTTLSGLELELVGSGYRLSLVKRRFVSGKTFFIFNSGISFTQY